MRRDSRIVPAQHLVLAIILSFLAGCASPIGTPDRSARVSGARAAGPSRRHRDAVAAPVETTALPPGALTLDAALRFVAEHHPDVGAARARLDAAVGRRVQAGLLPNPVLSARMESAPLSGRAATDAEYPIGITQRVPLGGRIGASRAVVDAELDALRFELERAVLDVERRVRGAFAGALFAREALVIERAIAEAAGEIAAIARERVDAGDAALDEQARAELEAARAAIAMEDAELLEAGAMLGLRAALGVGAAVPEIEGELESAIALPDLEDVVAALGETPLLRAQDASVRESEARVLREEASRVPDIDVGFFYRRVGESDSDAFDVGVAIALPIFDRRQGSLREARSRVAESRTRRVAAEVDLAARVGILHARLRKGIDKAHLFHERVAGRSQIVVDAAEQRYRAGATSLAELILARRDHRMFELERLDVLRGIALDFAEYRSLVAGAAGGSSE